MAYRKNPSGGLRPPEGSPTPRGLQWRPGYALHRRAVDRWPGIGRDSCSRRIGLCPAHTSVADWVGQPRTRRCGWGSHRGFSWIGGLLLSGHGTTQNCKPNLLRARRQRAGLDAAGVGAGRLWRWTAWPASWNAIRAGCRSRSRWARRWWKICTTGKSALVHWQRCTACAGHKKSRLTFR